MSIYALRQRSLLALADCLERGHGKDRELDHDIAKAVREDASDNPMHYTTETTAAVSLLADLESQERTATMAKAIDDWHDAGGTMRDWPRFLSAGALRVMAAKLEGTNDAA